ncbi:MAG: pyridoxal-phosphate dependent enzyme, partial [Vampirovibrionia bacterium]
KGYRYIHSGDEPDLISGVATHTLEILNDLPETEIIIVPVGGGSGAAGSCLAAKTINPDIKVIGVQAKNAPAAYLTWKNKAYTEANMSTFAEGVATRVPFMLPQSILWKYLDDFILVDEDEIQKSIALFYKYTHNIAEGAAATTLAAAQQIKDTIKDKNTVLIMSGGNLSSENLKKVFNNDYSN